MVFSIDFPVSFHYCSRMIILDPIDSAEFISSNATHVQIHADGIEKLAHKIKNALCSGSAGVENWKSQELTPSVANEQAVEWIFVTDLLNFSFWTDSHPHYEVSFGGKIYTGYWALCAAVNRAVDEGLNLLDANVYKDISEEQMKYVFRSANGSEIPLLKERWMTLQEAGKTLFDRYNGSFINVIKLCEKSAKKLLELLCQYFPSFRDNATYKGVQVSILKRAQILVGDLWSCFEGKGFGEFHDIDQITAFADYRVPQVLVHFGVLSYDRHLTEVVRGGEQIENGGDLEVEIRGCTLQAIQLIVRRTKQLLSERAESEMISAPIAATCNAILVDNFIWTYRRNHADVIDKSMPMHKTRCLFY
ncbi:unnamed protein product [Calicophoron daubneyi]|uniref:Queuosine 5'-phosphate N-glycosylase/hydrolase n=1 Tax=Calicophoron daubneyi TaxID=300641 RepID=A0AAV2T4J3_CALDB